MRFLMQSRRVALALALTPILLLAACGAPTSSLTSSPVAGATASHATGSTGSTITANTGLYDLMPFGQVSAVVGATISKVARSITTGNGEKAANCTYLPATGSGTHVAAEISYLFATNGSSAYATNKQDDASRGETETDLSGLGDSAFWAVKASNVGTLQLSVLTGNVLLVMTLLGVNPDGSSMLSGAEGLARQALPSL